MISASIFIYREDRIRTCDPLVPNQVLYQAELLPGHNYVKNAPNRSRTCNRLIRSQVLYPIELWVRKCRESESNRYGDHSPQDFKSCASASSATPAKQIAIKIKKSGRRGSNPRPPPWQGDVLPLNYFRIFGCRLKDLNPRPSDYKSDALPTELSRRLGIFNCSIIIARMMNELCRARTCDPLIKSQMLYQLS